MTIIFEMTIKKCVKFFRFFHFTKVLTKPKVHKLKKMFKLMGNLDIYFFFISISFIIWTYQIHEWEDISWPSSIHNFT